MVAKNLTEEYRSISQDISCRSLTTEVRVRWQANACGIYGGQSVMGQVLYRLFRYKFVSSHQHHTNISYIYNRSCTALLFGRSRDRVPVVSLGIFSVATDRTMCPRVDSASKNEYQEYLVGKGGRCIRLTTYHLRSAERQENPGS